VSTREEWAAAARESVVETPAAQRREGIPDRLAELDRRLVGVGRDYYYGIS
jgi:hypothetical protein